jgi:hypothetical protein
MTGHLHLIMRDAGILGVATEEIWKENCCL